MNKPELLMPAGDLEKTKIAFQFGADACYGSTSDFSMRTREIGFNYKTLKEAIDYAHLMRKKFYVTINIYAHEFDLKKIKKHVKKIISMQPDAIILTDPGVLQIVTKELKSRRFGNVGIPIKTPGNRKTKEHKIELHLSTQANATNSEAIKFWASQGVSRIIFPRELSLKEITKIRKVVPKKIMLEAFVHGAMCNSVSGRCNLSNYLSHRDANRGVCVQACRWKYALVEEKRPGQYIPVDEDNNGSYIYNSRDLCMIEHLDKLAKAGISSFKVEGRNKSIYYCAVVTRAYRKAIDLLCNNQAMKQYNNNKTDDGKSYISSTIKTLSKELLTVSTRGYSTGFYFNKPNQKDINYKTSRAQSDWNFVAIIRSKISPTQYLAEGRGEIFLNSNIEIVTPDKIIRTILKKLESPKNISLDKINPSYEFVITSKENIQNNSMIRTKNSNNKKLAIRN